MISQIIDVPNSNDYVLLIKENEETHVSFSFYFNRKELYDLYTQLRAEFQDEGQG
jgi:hypothetical protein